MRALGSKLPAPHETASHRLKMDIANSGAVAKEVKRKKEHVINVLREERKWNHEMLEIIEGRKKSGRQTNK